MRCADLGRRRAAGRARRSGPGPARRRPHVPLSRAARRGRRGRGRPSPAGCGLGDLGGRRRGARRARGPRASRRRRGSTGGLGVDRDRLGTPSPPVTAHLHRAAAGVTLDRRPRPRSACAVEQLLLHRLRLLEQVAHVGSLVRGVRRAVLTLLVLDDLGAGEGLHQVVDRRGYAPRVAHRRSVGEVDLVVAARGVGGASAPPRARRGAGSADDEPQRHRPAEVLGQGRLDLGAGTSRSGRGGPSLGSANMAASPSTPTNRPAPKRTFAARAEQPRRARRRPTPA